MHFSNFRVLKRRQNDADKPNNKTFQNLFSRWATDPALQSVQADCGAQSASYPPDIDSPLPKNKVWCVKLTIQRHLVPRLQVPSLRRMSSWLGA